MEEDFDRDAALSSISEGLMGVLEVDAPATEEVAAETPPAEEVGDASPGVPAPTSEAPVETKRPAPDTWRKEAVGEWEKLPPMIQDEVLKREEDAKRGLAEYKAKADIGARYDSVFAPYKPLMDQYKIDPIALTQSFAQAHYTLSMGSPEQKAALFTKLAKDYGIDLGQVAANQPVVDPALEPFVRELDQTKAELNRIKQSTAEGIRAQNEAAVNAFASDPKNIYFNEVAQDMVRLINGGIATTLEDAYSQAIRLNPAVSAKEQARLASEAEAARKAEAEAKRREAEKAKAVNLKSQAKNANGAVPVGSMEDTMRATLEKIQARH